jgi:lipoprotein-anchoring transpeptidase ErfK/SrfK
MKTWLHIILAVTLNVASVCELSLAGTVAPVRRSRAKATPAKTTPRAPRIRALELDSVKINDNTQTSLLRAGDSGSAVVHLQIEMDRSKFSPGEIDGRFNENTAKALVAFQAARHLPQLAETDAQTWAQLHSDPSPALLSYVIGDNDLAGPFQKIPTDLMQQAKLPSLGYSSPLEEIAERFHASPSLLRALNKGKDLTRAGEEVLVPNVLTPPPPPAAQVVVSASKSTVTALDTQGNVLASYPASIGSEHDPLPVGNWKILGVKRDPPFHYNPKLFWDAKPSQSRATIAPGPNNPVGVVWIDLSKEHYGIHGTPEPSTIGRKQSHGCIRLTNWDAAELAGMVKPGTPAILQN